MRYKCVYAVERKRGYMIYPYCKKTKEEAFTGCYKACPFFQERKYKAINKVSAKKEIVTPETYNKVYKRCDGVCSLCFTNRNLHLHHRLYRSERKDLINEPDNCLMLCFKCHQEVHKNKKYWQPILLEIIEEQKKRGTDE